MHGRSPGSLWAAQIRIDEFFLKRRTMSSWAARVRGGAESECDFNALYKVCKEFIKTVPLSCFMPVSKLSGAHCEFKDSPTYSVKFYLNLIKNSECTFPRMCEIVRAVSKVWWGSLGCKGRQEVTSGYHCPGPLWVIFLVFHLHFCFLVKDKASRDCPS